MIQRHILSPVLQFTSREQLPKPIVVYVTSFTEDSLKEFGKDLHKASESGQDVIPIVINSFGGSVYALLTMVAQVRTLPHKIVTIVEGTAMSAGAMLFLMGHERYLAPTASLMLHDMSDFLIGKTTDLAIEQKESERLRRQLFTLAERNCGLPLGSILDRLRTQANTNWYLTPKQALAEGFCTHVRVPELVTEVTVHFYLK